ncbi:extensin family protein [Bradyrhizobium sp. 2TAF24]|uniref:extensin family protein n=1 Tax=Bradyrhizobium sp. 2TAF24 TaxID=3233011 RepID=UPI003F8F2145
MLVWVLFGVLPVAARSDVPLPRPRPAAAPARPAIDAAADKSAAAETPVDEAKAGDGEAAAPSDVRPGDKPSARTGAATAPAVPPQSPCRIALTEEVAIAPSIAPIRGPGACGGEDLVRLEAVVLGGGRRVAVKPAAILRCPMARAIADWVRGDIAPLAERLGTMASEIDNFDSFECRGRNRVAGAKLSEHGRANALDVRGLRLASGRFISLTDRGEPRAVREEVLRSVCARFATVLGPGSDWYHEDHIHLDLAERRGGYRTCQWDVYDPLPAVAPLMPAERPPEAPPREVAETRGAAGAAAREAGQGAPEARQPEAPAGAEVEEPEAGEPAAAPPVPAPAKKSAERPARKRMPRSP